VTSPFSTIAKLHARLEYVRWGRRLPDLLQTLSGDVRERAAGAVVEAFVSRSQLFEIGRDGLVLPGGSCKVLEDPVKTSSKDLYGKKTYVAKPSSRSSVLDRRSRSSYSALGIGTDDGIDIEQHTISKSQHTQKFHRHS